MKNIIHLLLLGIIACNLTACGTKGRLKSPSQIEADEQKKARKEAKKAAEKTPSPLEGEGGVGGTDLTDKERTPPPNPLPQGEGE